jgi:peptidoglycan/xylan/chitin deacetylase (PgdA/CDA1 family)
VPLVSGVPRPSGAPGNLKVLDWAGFKGAVSWTFDDTQPSQAAHYVELAAVRVPMTFYLTVDSREKQPDFDRVWARAVREGNEIGNHTVNHCLSNMTSCLLEQHLPTIGEELDGCSDYIRAHTGQPDTWTAASPYGDMGYDAAARTRFLVNRGVRAGTIAPPGSGGQADPFELPSYVARAGDTEAVFERRIEAARADGRWIIMLLHTITPTSDAGYAPVSVLEVTAAMRYGHAMRDLWSDTVAAIGAYWRGQALLAAIQPTTNGAMQTWTWVLPPHFPPGKYLRVTVSGGTLAQGGRPLPWDDRGYYEVALDAGALTLAP